MLDYDSALDKDTRGSLLGRILRNTDKSKYNIFLDVVLSP